LQPAESRAAKQEVDSDREITVDAAIVRIMKATKTILHQELINRVIEVVEKTNFKPQPMYIKKRIDVLIEREYIERDERESNLYHYMA
jgi:hypothetical protein